MDEIIGLLRERNGFLKQFYTINKSEMFRFEEGDFSRIEFFYQSRDNILDLISELEKQLDDKLEFLEDSEDLPKDAKNLIRHELDLKDVMITEILNQDLVILAKIDEAKTQIIRDLQEVAKGKAAANGYTNASASQKRRGPKSW